MAIADDFSINFGAKTVTWVGTTGTYTTEALFEYLSDLMDDLANLDDDVPMDSATPQAYSIINGWQFGATVFEHLTGGGITDTTNDDLWTNLVTLGDLVAGQQIYVVQDGTEITPWWGPGALDVLIRVKQGGSLIDSGRVAVFARDWGNTFDVAVADLSKGAQQPVAIVTSDDIYNSTAVATVDGWNDITVTFGAVSKDLNNGSGARSYDVVVNCGGRRWSQVYERLKAITRHNSGFTVDGAAGEVYRRADDTYLEIKAAPFGTFAGTSFFGARGVWIENYSALDAKNFQLTDASGATQAPPNVVPVVVSGLVAGDSVAVFRLDGDGGAEYFADYDQWLQCRKDRLSVTSRSAETLQGPGNKKPRKSAYEARKELNRIEKQIEKAEGIAADLQRQLHDPEIMCDADRLAKRYAEHQEAQKKVEQLYERWEELEALSGE